MAAPGLLDNDTDSFLCKAHDKAHDGARKSGNAIVAITVAP